LTELVAGRLGLRLAVSALSPEVLRIRCSATGTWPARRPWAVTNLDGWAGRTVEVVVHGDGGSSRASVEDAGDWRITLPWPVRR
jgi:hypothetical protein